MIRKHVFILLGLSLPLSLAQADVSLISPLQLLHRCYVHFTGVNFPVDPTTVAPAFSGDPTPTYLLALKNLADTGTLENVRDACVGLLNHAELETATGSQKGKLKVDSDLGRKILRNFFSIFQTWSDVNNVIDVIPEDDFYYMTQFTNAQPLATTLTHLLFTPNVPYRAVVTATSPVERLGEQGAASPSGFQQAHSTVAPYSGGCDPALETCYDPKEPWTDAIYAQEGPLVGLLPVIDIPSLWNRKVNIKATYWVNGGGNGGAFYFKRGSGGGILSDPSWMLLQWSGKNFETKPVNASTLWRRYSRSVGKQLLCKDLPSIRTEDAAPFVNPNSNVAYWNTQSCVQCHATMDPLAAGIRNYGFHMSVGANTQKYVTMTKWNVDASLPPADIAIGAPLPDNDNLFYRRAPYGIFRMRSYTGQLFSSNQGVFQDVSELGQKLAHTEGFDDLYTCAVSRLYTYMTGIEVDLNDPAISGVELTAADLYYKEKVHLMGQQLRNHPQQSLRSIIEAIIRSPQYLRRNLRDEGF